MGDVAQPPAAESYSGTAAVEELRRIQSEQHEGRHVVKTVLDAIPFPLYATDAQGYLTYFNSAASTLWGFEPELKAQRWCGSWKLYSADGKAIRHDECPMATTLIEQHPVRGVEAILERPDGTRVPFMPYPTPIFGTDGKLVGGVNLLFDLTEIKRAQAQQKALIDELNHRVKNTLATVQSLAAQSFRDVEVGHGAKEAFEQRLLSLSKTHDHLTRECWEWADLKSIVSDTVAPYRGDQITLDGGPVRLAPKPALTLAMVLHELATNAAKYGALSALDGKLAITWSSSYMEDGKRRMRLEWHESNGPAVAPPTRRGFGSKLIERSITQDLGGTSEIAFEPAGLRYTCDVIVSR